MSAGSECEFAVLRGGYAAPVPALQLLWRLEAAGVQMRRDGEDILVEPLNRLTPADCDGIRRWKQHLLMLLDYEAPPI